MIEHEDAGRSAAIAECCRHIENCIEIIRHPRTGPKTRQFRVGVLELEISKLQALQADHPFVGRARRCLADVAAAGP